MEEKPEEKKEEYEKKYVVFQEVYDVMRRPTGEGTPLAVFDTLADAVKYMDTHIIHCCAGEFSDEWTKAGETYAVWIREIPYNYRTWE